MMVLVLEKVPASLRGELTRWMLEARSGVFIGDLSGMVRDRLWEKACESAKGGSVLLMYSADTEQGYAVRSYGSPDRTLVDFEGLMLFRRVPKGGRTRQGASPEPAGEASSSGSN